MSSGYAYLYDERLNDRKYDREVSRLEAEISRRGLNGRIGRFALFRHARDIMVELMRADPQTLVIVGDDQTLMTAMSALGETTLTIGYIPLLGDGPIARTLAIPKGLASVDVLMARYNSAIDLGCVGDRLFISELIVEGAGIAIEVDGQYKIEPPLGGSICIRNMGTESEYRDGKLDLFIFSPQESGRFPWSRKPMQQKTHLYFEEAQLRRSLSGICRVDGFPIEGENLKISVKTQALKIITGRRGRIALAGSEHF